MKKIVSLLLAMVMFIVVPCLAFDGYDGHEGQIPLCQNNKTGALRFAPMKDIDPATNKNYEPHCSTLTETMIWMNIQGIQGPQGPKGDTGDKGPKGDTGSQGPAGVGNLGVYDGSGLFLGYLIESTGNPDLYRVYDPTIPAMFNLLLKVPLTFEHAGIWYLMFTSPDCSSQPYIHNNECYFYNACDYGHNNNNYYVYDAQSQFPIVSLSDIKSYRDSRTGECLPTPLDWSGNAAVYPVKQITVPYLFNQTLEYPIVVKPVQ